MFTITWEDFSLFLEIDCRHAQTANAIQGDKSRFKNFQEWFQGKDWTTENVRLFLADLKRRGLKQETINKHISFAHNIDKYLKLEETKYIRSEFVRPKRIKEVLSVEQIRNIAFYERPYKKYKEYLQSRNCALYMLLGSIGCRIGEALNLTWDNVGSSPVKHVYFPQTKNGDEREVPISDELWDLIHAIPRRNQYVFATIRGTGIGNDGLNALQAQEINTDLKLRAEAIGIGFNVHNHIFRHSWTTEMKNRGVPDSDICLIAGWRDPRMLQRYDGSGLKRMMAVLQVHPLMQNSMSELEKVQKIIESARLFYSPDTHRILPNMEGNKITLTIEPL